MTIAIGHINSALTNFAAGTAKNLEGNFIADQIAPIVSVANKSDAYYVYGDDDTRLDSVTYKSGAHVNRIRRTTSEDSYTCKEYAQEEQIPLAEMANADAGFQRERRATVGVVNKLKLAHEKRVADTLFATGTFTNTAALTGADRWDVDTSNPVSKANTGIAAVRTQIGVEANVAVLGADVWTHLRIHPDITSRVAGLVAGTPATLEQAAAALGVDRVLVGKAIYNTAKRGGTASYGDVWGKYAAFCYIDPAAGLDPEGVITPIKAFAWEGVRPRYSISTYREDQTLSHVVQGYDCVGIKAVAVGSVYLYSTVVS